jgi:hypothetical protein
MYYQGVHNGNHHPKNEEPNEAFNVNRITENVRAK